MSCEHNWKLKKVDVMEDHILETYKCRKRGCKATFTQKALERLGTRWYNPEVDDWEGIL